ncbi:MAG: alpha/beta hydrolase [Flavobacteriia bacterium]|nr:alpha/beta hydrolase [Flavobacteriia bacterium]
MKHMATLLLLAIFSTLSNGQVIEITNANGTFHGEWRNGSGVVAVVIIPGSGSVDRDGNSGGMQGNDLAYLADSLMNRGFSVLTTDKMNAQASKVNDPSKVRFEDFISLANDWVNVVADSGYTDITVIGHSQGALTALELAKNDKVTRVVSLCGAGNPISEILKHQYAQQIPEPYITGIKAALDSLRDGYFPSSPHFSVNALFAPGNREFLASWMAFDPCESIKDITKPVLIIGGSTDIQVVQEEGDRLSECNPSAEYVIIEGMGHMLRKAPGARMLALSYYGNPDLPLHSELTTTIVEFITNN